MCIENWKNPSRCWHCFLFRIFKMSSLNIYKLSITINIVQKDAEINFIHCIAFGLKEGFLMEVS